MTKCISGPGHKVGPTAVTLQSVLPPQACTDRHRPTLLSQSAVYLKTPLWGKTTAYLSLHLSVIHHQIDCHDALNDMKMLIFLVWLHVSNALVVRLCINCFHSQLECVKSGYFDGCLNRAVYSCMAGCVVMVASTSECRHFPECWTLPVGLLEGTGLLPVSFNTSAGMPSESVGWPIRTCAASWVNGHSLTKKHTSTRHKTMLAYNTEPLRFRCC